MPPAFRKIARILAAILFLGAGVLHFRLPQTFAKIVPPFLPWPVALVYISGGAEIAGGIGLLVPALRSAASLGLIALLIAVFPANVYMALDRVQVTASPLPVWELWARLPLQLVLIGWVWSCGIDK
jgi:uncharacterized membrane protein